MVRAINLIAASFACAVVCANAASPALPTDIVSCAYHDSNEVALRLRAEADCLSRLEGRVARIGDTLEITLKDGNTKTFISNYEACEEGESALCIQYWLSAYYPKARSVVLKVRLYESASAEIVNIDSGNVTVLEDEPHFSPSGDRFAVVKGSESETVDKAIVIYATASDPPTLEFAHSVPDGKYALYSFVRWEGETRVKMKLYTRINGRRDPEDVAAEVVRGKPGWQLRSPPPGP